MNKSGYVKFDRKILNWTWYTNVNTFKLFFHFIMSANYADSSFLGVEVKRGQLARSYTKLAEETGLTLQEIRTAIKNLKSTREVTQTSHPKFSVFTVVNYDKYQTANTNFNSRATREQHAFNTDLTRVQHGEKKKKKNNNIINNNKGEAYAHAREGSFCREVVDSFNSLCTSLPPVKNLTPSREEATDKLLATYNLDTIRDIFKKAQASSFLRGEKNKFGRDWSATFDWLIDTGNAVKVLEGLYDDREPPNRGPENTSSGEYDFDAFEKMAFEKLHNSG